MMKVKYYFVFFAAFVLIVGGGFYALNSSESAIALGQNPLTLPNAIWLVIAITLFFILSLLFFTSNWILRSLYQYRLDRDYQKLISQIYAQILQDPNSKSPAFATQDYKILSKVIKKLQISPKLDTPECGNEKIDTLFGQLQEINHGNISKLPLTQANVFWKKNTQNKLQSDPKFAQKVIEEDYEEELKEEAIRVLAQNNLFSEKLLSKLTKESLPFNLANSLLTELLKQGYRLSQDEFVKIILASKPNPSTYLELAKTFKSQFDPEYTLALFLTLLQSDRHAQEAYAYLLLDYGMSEKAQDFIAEHDELVLPKIYLELKQSGKFYPLEMFFGFKPIS